MGEDWSPGDLALCVCRCGLLPFIEHRPGAVYTVAAVSRVGLRMKALPMPVEVYALAECFRKIGPHVADAEDLTTIDLLGGVPVEVGD